MPLIGVPSRRPRPNALQTRLLQNTVLQIEHAKLPGNVSRPNMLTGLPGGEAQTRSSHQGVGVQRPQMRSLPTPLALRTPGRPVICWRVLLHGEDLRGFLTPYPGVAHSSQLNECRNLKSRPGNRCRGI